MKMLSVMMARLQTGVDFRRVGQQHDHHPEMEEHLWNARTCRLELIAHIHVYAHTHTHTHTEDRHKQRERLS